MPSKELEKWLIYELDNVHLKEGAPEHVQEEFNALFGQSMIDIKLQP